MKETPFLRSLMGALGALPELRLWRQNAGTAWVPISDKGRDLLKALTRRGMVRPIDLGPPVGAADLTGIVLGSGLRLEIETKAERGRLSSEQVAWSEFIERAGGVYVLARPARGESLEQAVGRSAAEVLRRIDERRR